MPQDWRPVETPPKETYHDLMRAAAHSRRAGHAAASARADRRRRAWLALVTLLLMAASGVGGFYGGRWVKRHNDKNSHASASVTTLPNGAYLLDTATFSLRLPRQPNTAKGSLPTTANEKTTVWTVSGQGDYLTVTAADYAPLVAQGFDSTDANATKLEFTFLANALGATAGNTVVKSAATTSPGGPAWSVEVHNKSLVYYGLYVFHGSTLVVIYCRGTTSGPTPDYNEAVATLHWK